MKKTTLKITVFLLLTMFAFQGYAQPITTIVEGTKYNLRNVGTGDYLKANGEGQYEFTSTAPTGEDNTFNFTFYHHNTIDPGADGEEGTADDVVHNYTNDWNIQGDVRGIMRASNTGTVHTNFKYDRWNSNGGHKTDKRWEETTSAGPGGVTIFRFSPLTDQADPDRFLYQGTDGVLYNYSVADMNDEAIASTNGEDSSYWVLTEAVVLSVGEFDISSVFISNPVQNEISIKGLNSNVKQVSVYSLLGTQVLTKKLGSQTSLKLDVSNLTRGMYLVELKGDNGIFTKKIVKQ